MARGKNTSEEKIIEIMTAYANNPNNIMEVSRTVGMPEPTVRQIIIKNKDKEEYKRLQDNKKKEFADKATEIINLALKKLKETVESSDNIPVNQLTTAIGTLYDKRALSLGEATHNCNIIFLDNLKEDEEQVFCDDI